MSLRTLLTVPYVALLLTLAAVVGWLSYSAADQSVDELAGRLSAEATNRISDTTVAYLNNWHYVLAATAVDRWDSAAALALEGAEEDLWRASAVSSVRPSYVYLAAADGRFVGVQRPVAGPALLKWRAVGKEPRRSLYEIQSPGDRKTALGAETDPYNAIERPWFERASQSKEAVWSQVYLDHASHQPMVTLARAYRHAQGKLQGEVSHVVGADVPLVYLQTFLQGLDIVPGGVAFIMTRDGKLVASSQAAHALPASARALPTITQHADPLLTQAARTLGAEVQRGARPISTSFEDPQAGRMLVAAAPMTALRGMDWWVVVSLPDDTLMANVRRNAYRTAALALAACVVAVAIGALVLNRLAADIGRLTQAAEQLSLDATPEPIALTRGGELGRMASAFNRMGMRLMASNNTVREQNVALARTVSDLEQQIVARDSADTRLRRIADALQEGLIVLDQDWCITFANARSERYFQRKVHELLGTDVRKSFTGLESSEYGEAVREALRGNHAVTTEAPALTVPGMWIELRLFPTPFGLAAFFSDITAQRNAREALADRERQLSQLAGELLRIQTEERRTIAHELHDEFGQALGALRINLQMTAGSLPSDAQQQRQLAEALAQATQLLSQVRDRALDLHPAVLDDLGLFAALQWWCERQSQRSGVPIVLHASAAAIPRLSNAVELACFRIVQEAMVNALKHAEPSRIDVSVEVGNAVHISITDDGVGITRRQRATSEPATGPRSLGLTSMRERAQQLGGVLKIENIEPTGTAVRLTMPVERTRITA
jgi:signal transduction histidine kinase